MFFGLAPVADHPCCRMQEMIEAFFFASIDGQVFSVDLFPEWIKPTLEDGRSTLKEAFEAVHALLHAAEMDREARRAIHEEVVITNRIAELCNGALTIPMSLIDWKSPLGVSITTLMIRLYDSLDLAVFRREGVTRSPTQQFYQEFIEINGCVCPFCALEKFKNPQGVIREDFDHYLHKSKYPFASANMRNLIPTCGTCNKGYKGTKNILSDGLAFYPYSQTTGVRIEVECEDYPDVSNFKDSGNWKVKLELVTPDPGNSTRMKAWNRVYGIRDRLVNEVKVYFDEWMKQICDDQDGILDEAQYRQLIASAKQESANRSLRRMAPQEFLKEAFYDFMLTKADEAFVESFRQLRNNSVTHGQC